MTARLRPGQPADVDAVAAVFLACWQRSYHQVLPDAVRAVYDESSARELWQRALSSPGTVVAEVNGRGVVGVVRFGASAGTGHVFSLYVHPDSQDQGLGRKLLDVAIESLRSSSYDEATLWVFANNVAARGFYERLGWRPDGGRRVEPEYGRPEIRLRRSLQ